METKMETIIYGLGFRDVTPTMENQMDSWVAVKELKLILLMRNHIHCYICAHQGNSVEIATTWEPY